MTDNGVQLFAADGFGKLAVVLALGQMNEQIGDIEHGIASFITDAHINFAAVGAMDDAVQREGLASPLIFFDAAVVMGLEQGEFAVFIERMRFEIESWRIDVRADDVHAGFQRTLADDEEDDGFVLVVVDDLCAGFWHFSGSEHVGKVDEAVGVRLTGHLGCAFALGLAGVEKCFVAFAVGEEGVAIFFGKILPETWVFVFKFHGMISFHIPAAGLAINDKTWYNQYSMKRDRMTAPVHRGRMDNIEENDQSRDGHHRFLHGGHFDDDRGERSQRAGVCLRCDLCRHGRVFSALLRAPAPSRQYDGRGARAVFRQWWRHSHAARGRTPEQRERGKRRLRKKIGALTGDAVRLERRRFCLDHWRKNSANCRRIFATNLSSMV